MGLVRRVWGLSTGQYMEHKLLVMQTGVEMAMPIMKIYRGCFIVLTTFATHNKYCLYQLIKAGVRAIGSKVYLYRGAE